MQPFHHVQQAQLVSRLLTSWLNLKSHTEVPLPGLRLPCVSNLSQHKYKKSNLVICNHFSLSEVSASTALMWVQALMEKASQTANFTIVNPCQKPGSSSSSKTLINGQVCFTTSISVLFTYMSLGIEKRLLMEKATSSETTAETEGKTLGGLSFPSGDSPACDLDFAGVANATNVV